MHLADLMCLQSDVSYEVFRDRFTASTNTAFKEVSPLLVPNEPDILPQ